uniref:Uncharacterized protein C4orf29 n=1 Tax=Lygus hesperus TaxID=30085 RepID=A0A0A9YFA7_LYGHE
MGKCSMVDRIYRSLLLSKYFTKGWGSPKDIKRLLEFRKDVSDRNKCVHLVPDWYPVEITKDQVSRGVRYVEGKFHSPFDLYLPELLPHEVKSAHFQMILPVEWKNENYKPICIHMAGTGDHLLPTSEHLLMHP